MKYGSFGSRQYRYTRGAPRQYACIGCGNWMMGSDNHQFSCTECAQRASSKVQAELLAKERAVQQKD